MSLADYDRWLHKAANDRLGVGHAAHDDLVQEGRIAMWGQVEKHGREHAGFMTSQARLRMGDVARGAKAFGGIKVAVRDVAPATSVEALEAANVPVLAYTSDPAPVACLAYHRQEIADAVDRLTPSERRAAKRVMNDEPRSAADRAAWTTARRKLAVDLDHLRGLV